MTVGPSATAASEALDAIIGAGLYVQLHTADPGAAGTTSACTGTVGASRKNAGDSTSNTNGVADFNESSLSWASWDGGSVAVTHISLWTAATAGSFRQSVALSSSVALVNGDTFVLDTLQLTCNKAS